MTLVDIFWENIALSRKPNPDFELEWGGLYKICKLRKLRKHQKLCKLCCRFSSKLRSGYELGLGKQIKRQLELVFK